jgi:hypothetical protein
MSNQPDPNDELKGKDALEFKWKEYALYIEHFRYYLEITLKTNIFFYVSTGGVVGFYLSTSSEAKGTVKYFFLLPIFVGTALTGMFIYGANLWRKAYVNSQKVKEVIETKLVARELPDTHLVFLYLWLSAIMFSIVGLALAVLPTFLGDASWRYLVSSISLAIIGLLLPRLAPKIDRGLKRERLLSNKRGLFNKLVEWERVIQSKEFAPWALEEEDFYNDLGPFLSKKTRKRLRRGTLTREWLLAELDRIKARNFREEAPSSPPAKETNSPPAKSEKT